MRIVLLGRNYYEKRSAGNTILGRDAFRITGYSNFLEMSRWQRAEGEVCGRRVTVIITPEMTRLRPSPESMMEQEKGISLCAPGPHAFLLVMSPEELSDGQCTRAENYLTTVFGPNALTYMIILFTYEKMCPKTEEIKKKSEGFKTFLEKIQGRYIVMNNEKRDLKHVQQLLEKIDSMVQRNGGRYYNGDINTKPVTDLPAALMVPSLSSTPLTSDCTPDMDKTCPPQTRPTPPPVPKKPVKCLPPASVVPSLSSEPLTSACTSDMAQNHPSPPRVPPRTKVCTETRRETLVEKPVKCLPPASVVPSLSSEPLTSACTPDMAQNHPSPPQVPPRTKVCTETRREMLVENVKLQEVMRRLGLERFHPKKLTTADVLMINKSSLGQQEHPQADENLAFIFVQKILTLDYRGREVTLTHDRTEAVSSQQTMEDITETDLMYFIKQKIKKANRRADLHPMDGQMAVFHCADDFLRQYMMTKLSFCQYALPLLVPSPITAELEIPLWTFREVKKTWKTLDANEGAINRNMPVCNMFTPMVFFFRMGDVTDSKSQLLNLLINPRHNTFFHRHCPGSTRTRLLMDGVVEIAWYCPSGKRDDTFSDCVAFCNLHGDAEKHTKQMEVLTNAATVNVVLLHEFSQYQKKNDIFKWSFQNSKPSIFLFVNEETFLTPMDKNKFQIGLKYRNQAEIIEELRMVIAPFLKRSSPTFNLEDFANLGGFSIDETEKDCQWGKVQVEKMVKELKGVEFSQTKEKLLPCQGEPWQKWCQKSKDLFRLHGNITMMESQIREEMKSLRKKQRVFPLSNIVKTFIRSLQSATSSQKIYFLKWLGNVMDDCCEDHLSAIVKKYNTVWTEVFQLKNKHKVSDDLVKKQEELEKVSKQLSDGTCSLEHIMREMGQIYEAWESDPQGLNTQGIEDISLLPALAADMMISGYPLELMDGDAACVPMQWINAVLHKLQEILRNPRVFVLSVLGLQSTGKSTMLNAMFGLQFAVSAGRCTRGAFMQLVKVSEDAKADLGTDYILVVDTEGLRALELVGKAAVHHDNEMATFVIGLGNMTLINVFGENPAEIQDTLQIAIQAFLRMKKVKLAPSCIFVHQNVADISAGEKNMEGKRRLQEKLDEMTQLAGKEEDCDVKCFSDVISFDVTRDIRYIPQLWEGNPPMAPPNPRYAESVQDLKRIVLSLAKEQKGLTISDLRIRILDLWNALLNEDFVFSFKNTLEIVAYRKLEVEYGNWTWTLRSAMQTIENKLYNRVENGSLGAVQKVNLQPEFHKTCDIIKTKMTNYFSEDKDKEILAQWRSRIERRIEDLCTDLVDETKKKFDNIIEQKAACKSLDEQKSQYEHALYKRSADVANRLKKEGCDESKLKSEFESMWEEWASEVENKKPTIKDIDIWQDVTSFLEAHFEAKLISSHITEENFKKNFIPAIGKEECNSFLDNFIKKGLKFFGIKWRKGEKNISFEEEKAVRELCQDIDAECREIITKAPVRKHGYNRCYIQEVINQAHARFSKFMSNHFLLKKEFRLHVLLYVCNKAAQKLHNLHIEFMQANDPRVYLERKKPYYQQIFQIRCKDKTSAAVLAVILCSVLKPQIVQAVYDKAAIDVADRLRSTLPEFMGNRSNLEKYFLKSLAEKLDFDEFIMYVHQPKEFFTHFVKQRVDSELFMNENTTVLQIFKDNLKVKMQCVTIAVTEATRRLKTEGKARARVWLDCFSQNIGDDLTFSEKELTGVELEDIQDFESLKDMMFDILQELHHELSSEFSSVSSIKMDQFRETPADLLIKQLTDCCWVRCPFCGAICTGTIKGHPGDHSVTFHRPIAVTGWHCRNTDIFSILICTTAVASDRTFYPRPSSETSIEFKKYRDGGPKYACWSITSDCSELPYWKWMVCQFREKLENHYKYRFYRYGEIPLAWEKLTKEEALQSLELI